MKENQLTNRSGATPTYDCSRLGDKLVGWQSLAADIATAILDLESVRTEKNRDAIVWAQYVLTACKELAKSVMDRD